MSSKKVILVAVIFAVYQGPAKVEAGGLVEMISDYAKVVKNTERPATSTARTQSTLTTLPPENTTDPAVDYEDFDDLQEEEDRSLKQPSSTETMMKYFNGLVSLLALMYKFNGSFGGGKPPKAHIKNQNEPREKLARDDGDKLRETPKHFQVAQDRFEFPQKKFKYHDNQINDNMIDQQYQPVENYPPYNPLKANTAETYNKDDKKTSYDADLMQYDLTKNSMSDYSPDVDIQQSYSYEIPYENPKPVQSHSAYDLTNNGGDSWNTQNIHPVYHSWMTKTPTDNKPTNDENSHQGYKTIVPIADKPASNDDSYNPWNSKIPEVKPQNSEGRKPWIDKPLDFPIYHHDFKDSPPHGDHHFEYHEIEHPMMDEDRVSKKPYSYYFLGRKLWYVPLLFSVYFIIYVGALVLKSVARHKIQFPEKIWNLHDEHFDHGKHRRHRKVDDITENYEKAVEKMNNKYM